jgi:hypothetical protein
LLVDDDALVLDHLRKSIFAAGYTTAITRTDCQRDASLNAKASAASLMLSTPSPSPALPAILN